MPRRKCCEHPTRHIDSPGEPKVQRSVSLRLDRFMRDWYDLGDVNVSGLCAKCRAFESKQMAEDEAMDVEETISPKDDMFNDDEQDEEKKEEDDDYDDDNNDICDEDENSDDDSLHELTYQQQEAMETLSNVFQMLNMSLIHDQ
ncbi:unnamed protein product [Didymodactylos carnosus]|uniref:Uncharacterized protein n=1 Tax=Didymodactylos carnosus TaxID=1234261 RepID=A0A815GJL9_9BILA|nr:unnamed protein product [Didymodactylos carnosus]CAF1417286.1 unnamed protein product [Didymodactylos carnosus]CAF4198580.1 unnamed protein product [Didymodactylos carnosus]CAF4219187.1 unnamed protein product [Didymodactylos carnosus]